MTLALLRVLVLPLFLGAGVLRALGVAPRTDPLAWLGWSWTAGALAAGLVTFAWLWTPLPVESAWALDLAVLALGAACFAVSRRRPALAPRAVPATPRWERALFALVVTGVVAITVQRVLAGNLEPIYHNDEAHFWALKAKVIFHASGFNADFARAMSNEHFVYHKDYPLLNPLLSIWTYAHFGQVTHVVSRLPIQMFALALALVLASALRRAVRPAVAAALLSIYFALPETGFQTRTAHADLMVGLGALLVFDAWRRGSEAASSGDAAAWWRLGTVWLAFMLWSKNEGLLYLTAIAAAWAVSALVLRRGAVPRGARLGWLGVPAGMIALTWGFNAWYGFENDIAIGDTREHSFAGLLVTQARSHVPTILRWFHDNLLWNPEHAAFLPLAFAALVVAFPRRVWSSPLRFPCLAIIFTGLGYVVIFTGTPHALEWHLPTALGRVSWQAVPALTLWIAAAARELLPFQERTAPGP